MRVLLFKEYEAGFNNRLMSLELGVGLAHLTGRTLVFYQGREGGCYAPADQHRLEGQRPTPSLMDLMEDPPVPHMQLEAYRSLQRQESWEMREEELELPNVVFARREDPRANGRADRLECFREFRSVIHDAPESVWHLQGTNLGFYSRFFFEPTPGLYSVMRDVRPRAPYLALAERVAASLGEFDGVHVRLTDFRRAHPRHRRDVRRIRRTLRQVLPGDLPILVCTDEPENHPFLEAILGSFRERILLDEYILGEFGEPFDSLPFSDHVTLGLLCNLVMWRCRRFAGTPGSTYTALIHRGWLRRRLAEGVPLEELDFRFIESGLASSFGPRGLARMLRYGEPMTHFRHGAYLENRPGPFTWNRTSMRLHTAAKSWWREWPEAVVGEPVAIAARPPAGESR